MRINEAASRSGVSASTIRYYEEQGLLPGVKRTASGYRAFDERDVALLTFLRKARDIGFTVSECRELLDLVATPSRHNRENVSRTRELAAHRLEEIREQIGNLERMSELIQLHIDSLDQLGDDCPVTREL